MYIYISYLEKSRHPGNWLPGCQGPKIDAEMQKLAQNQRKKKLCKNLLRHSGGRRFIDFFPGKIYILKETMGALTELSVISDARTDKVFCRGNFAPLNIMM